ncbi:MAG: bifunctional salicylyl-CoA 5-hydroxylase/oxidoreductase [Planctomycetes bacterium]|nr:bifunctional salicylyl-CoA 5-hydroxylase/oxidoreductase [Planctomycetota bacterium]
MKVACIGGGPASLYFALLLKRARPTVEIDVFEQNRPDDTFGQGVVFSDETLGNFETADPQSYAAIRQSFVNWNDIETFYAGAKVVSTGHGFCGLSRVRLLQILHDRCRTVGVRLHFQHTVTDIDAVVQAHDLVVAADGVNSRVRERYAVSFRPSLDWRKCKFAWFGTDKEMRAFTFVFQPTQWGLFQVHAYPFQPGRGTWIVECREEVWRAAGLDTLDEVQSAAFCKEVFADHLQGQQLLINRSIWRTFPTIRCASWRHENVVLMGDAAHTAHFSIGSGTKLAMEDAIALAAAFERHGNDVRAALAAYEEARFVDVLKIQRAAQTSLEWFENSGRYQRQSPERFVFNLMTRSRKITWDNLRQRDPALVATVDAQVAREEGTTVAAGTAPPPPAFAPYRLRSLRLHNRVVVSPMCQYSATDGVPNDWHLVHLGARATGGAALVFTEMTNVSPEGRITPGCTGIWNETQMLAWRRIVEFVHRNTAAKIGLQLAHAGRKGSCSRPWEGDRPLDRGGWQTLGPSALPFSPGNPAPKAMDRGDLDLVREQFVRGARLCEQAGFDTIELHMAHGYLLSSFLSPLSNLRTDDFGGTLASRARFPLEVFRAVRAVWPASKPLVVRISATDWLGDRGFTPDEAVQFARWLLDDGCDLLDVSTAGNSPESKPEYGRMYQVPFAERIKYEVGIPVMTVGGIAGIDHANTVIGAGRADLCAIARAHLADPYLTLRAAKEYGVRDFPWPPQYLAAKG